MYKKTHLTTHIKVYLTVFVLNEPYFSVINVDDNNNNLSIPVLATVTISSLLTSIMGIQVTGKSIFVYKYSALGDNYNDDK